MRTYFTLVQGASSSMLPFSLNSVVGTGLRCCSKAEEGKMMCDVASSSPDFTGRPRLRPLPRPRTPPSRWCKDLQWCLMGSECLVGARHICCIYLLGRLRRLPLNSPTNANAQTFSAVPALARGSLAASDSTRADYLVLKEVCHFHEQPAAIEVLHFVLSV
eukprot:GHVT01093640.1.p1 GENE.GHVT01093640.1~~GHVT01093640.1.p1  ORF type:complete len:161 (+),score=13.55 GHVT01093640.1:132-614(+)